MTNPFAPNVPAQPAEEPPPGNPFAASPAPQPGNPYAAPVQPQPYGAPAPQAPPAYAPPPGVTHMQHVQNTYQGTQAPPALDMNRLGSVPPPPPAGDGKGAKLPDMYGRLVLVFPLAITRRPRNPQFITQEQRARGDLEQDQITATVVVLDDGQGGMQPIAYGGAPYELPPRPHTESAPLPYVRKAMWITQSRLIGQLRDLLPQPGQQAGGMAVGRVVKAGPQRNDPWYLQGANDQEINLARQYLLLVQNGQYPHPLAP